MSNTQWLPGPAGAALRAIFDEMDRQGSDARESFADAGEVAVRLAASARRTGRLILLGMGGSHAVNRVAEACYRDAVIDATALPVSEMLHAPIPGRGRTVLVTSQSGESGEVIAYLATDATGEERYGMTLNPESALAREIPCVIGHGGMERAFAATRSLYVSLALHARVLHELGVPQDASFRSGDIAAGAIDAAVSKLSSAQAIIFSGRGAMQGVAEAAALCLLELARVPAFALEGGQLRHGPPEALGPGIGVVLIRQAGAGSGSGAALAKLCSDAGSPVIMFDLSGDPPPREAITISLSRASGMAAALAVLPPIQQFGIEIARRRIADVGAPVRSSKVTRGT